MANKETTLLNSKRTGSFKNPRSRTKELQEVGTSPSKKAFKELGASSKNLRLRGDQTANETTRSKS